MTDQIAELLLTEFREFRKSVSEWQQDTGERVATLESQVKTGITGNGQASRLKVVEDKVESLEHIRWREQGIGVALWSLLTIVLHFLPWGGKH